MFINAPALKRQENSFKIIHNKTEYSVDPIKMAENSKFFAESPQPRQRKDRPVRLGLLRPRSTSCSRFPRYVKGH